MTETLTVRIEWLEAPDVSTPELAATWARYEVWAGARCVTQVEGADGTFRRSVYGSLYPLAEWIATNWWFLTSHMRPSAVESRYWAWRNIQSHPWLRSHNLRGAGDGMSWPNLTIVPEGIAACLHWSEDALPSLGRVRFVSAGNTWIETDAVVEGLSETVNHVLERLSEMGLHKTNLAEEWQAVSTVDAEERAVCQIVARLGLDPYSVNDDLANVVISVASSLPSDLLNDFFDSVDADSIEDAAEWTRRAEAAAYRAMLRADRSIDTLYEASRRGVSSLEAAARPWQLGYAMAREIREELDVHETARFDPSPWVGTIGLKSSSSGIQGYVVVDNDRCGLALGSQVTLQQVKAFRQARTLGRVLANPGQRSFLLSRARGYDERVAGAFAAELLAPAGGIRWILRETGEIGDWALDEIARQFGVSPLVVRHQYDNQIAVAWGP